MQSNYMGADWIERQYAEGSGFRMSETGRVAAELLGDVFLGIYHLNVTSLLHANWGDEYTIAVTIDRSLASFDGDELTRLVMLAHDRMLRVEIAPCSPRHLKLYISRRKTRDGSIDTRCPTLENHVAYLRNHYKTEVLP